MQNFLNDVPAIKAKQDDRFEVEQEFQLLKDKWIEIESEVDFIQIIENYEKEIQERLNQKEQEWLKQFTVDASVLNRGGLLSSVQHG